MNEWRHDSRFGPTDPASTRDRLEHEAAAAQELREHTSFAVPQPIAIGEPGAGYPLPWHPRHRRVGPADPALDLVAAWQLDTQRRSALRAMLHCDDLEWERGKAWAFQQSMGLVWYYEASNPTMSRLGRRTLDQIQAAEPP